MVYLKAIWHQSTQSTWSIAALEMKGYNQHSIPTMTQQRLTVIVYKKEEGIVKVMDKGTCMLALEIQTTQLMQQPQSVMYWCTTPGTLDPQTDILGYLHRVVHHTQSKRGQCQSTGLVHKHNDSCWLMHCSGVRCVQEPLLCCLTQPAACREANAAGKSTCTENHLRASPWVPVHQPTQWGLWVMTSGALELLLLVALLLLLLLLEAQEPLRVLLQSRSQPQILHTSGDVIMVTQPLGPNDCKGITQYPAPHFHRDWSSAMSRRSYLFNVGVSLMTCHAQTKCHVTN